MIRRWFAVLVAVALLAVACSGSGTVDEDDLAEAPTPPPPQGSILPPADPDGPGNGDGPAEEEAEENPDDGRLVVQGADGQLSTMLPDGNEPMVLTDDPNVRHAQASWAPDGSRIAWVSVDNTTGESWMSLDRFDRSDLREVPLETAPFYLYWDPSAARVATLGPATGGIDLSVVEPFDEDGPSSRRLDRGQPYFFSWGPDGDELLVHASGFRLDRIDLGESTVIIDEFPGSFGAPAWLEDNSLMFTDLDDVEQFLVTTGPSGEGRRPLVTYIGTLRFTVSNQGNRIVMQANPTLEDDSVVTASTDAPAPEGALLIQAEPTPTPEFDDSLDAIDPLTPGIPYVMGTFGGEPFPLSSTPAIALFPSPDGQTIAWFERDFVNPDALIMRVDKNGEQFSSVPFIPSSVSANEYLPFFDQYEQSHDFWSPSSELFVYAGRPADDPAAPDGIWIYNRSTDETIRITDGVVASFTRTPDASGAASAL